MINENIKKWIVKALEDLRIAQHEIAFPDDEISTSPVCFHCQQVVEKLLKAYLISKGIEFSKTHDLEHLLHLCERADGKFGNLHVANLTFYAVEARYPDEFYIPTVDEVRECLGIALLFKNFVPRKLGMDEKDVNL